MLNEKKWIEQIREKIASNLQEKDIVIYYLLPQVEEKWEIRSLDDYAYLSQLQKNSHYVDLLLQDEHRNDDFKRMIEVYLDCRLIEKMLTVRQITAEDMEECKAKLRQNQVLNPFYKDCAYLGCTLENIGHHASLDDYRKYKKVYCKRIGS